MKVVWWVTAALLVAGCVGGKPPEPDASPQAATSGSGMGTIEVTVTTTELAPVEGVEVVLFETMFANYTDANGYAVFTDLEPRNYTVVAAKPGFRPVQERGRAVDVLADEVATVKLTLDRVELVTPGTSYYKTIPFNGFMTCSLYGAVIGYTSYCGRGVTTTSGQQVGDPNDRTIHPWDVENVQIQTMLFEVKWTPSQATLGSQLWARIMATTSCTGASGQSCEPYDQIDGRNGKSPLIVRKDEGDKNNLTKKIAVYNKGKFPYKVYDEVRAWCHSATAGGDCYLTLMINQRYEGWQSAFYGAPQPDGFTALPPG